jgi:Uma2 family endonuclease
MLKPTPPNFPVEEYLWQEQRAKFKSEYHDGLIYAMAGGSLEHGQIQANLITELTVALRGRDCQALTSDVKVGVATSKNYGTSRKKGDFISYPDASVICGSPEFYKGDRFTIANPVLLFEVSSPSTRNYDHSVKFEQYLSIPSLAMYVLIDSEQVRVEVFQRSSSGWLVRQPLESQEDILKLPPIEAEIALKLLYDRLEFEEDEDN